MIEGRKDLVPDQAEFAMTALVAGASLALLKVFVLSLVLVAKQPQFLSALLTAFVGDFAM